MSNKKSLGIYSAAGLLATGFLVFLDQWTKRLAVEYLAGQADRDLIPGILRLHYLENRGAAFGILQDRQLFFIILTSLFLILPAACYLALPRTRRMLPLHMTAVGILAGGLGNLIDRVRQQFVVDFLETEFMEFPVFNVADIYVTVSFAVLVLLVFFKYKEEDFQDFHLFGKRRKERTP